MILRRFLSRGWPSCFLTPTAVLAEEKVLRQVLFADLVPGFVEP